MLRNRIKKTRYGMMLKQTEFAELIGVDSSQVSRWEKQYSQPGLESLWKISKKLNISINDLLEEVPE